MPTGSPVVLTREGVDNEPLARLLAERGVPVWRIPCARTEYLDIDWPAGPFDVVAFSSRRAVRGMERAGELALLKKPGDQGPAVAAVGEATAAELENLGVTVDITAEPPTGKRLAQMLDDAVVPGGRVALVCATQTTGIFQTELASRGIEVAEIPAYRNVSPPIPKYEPQAIAAIFFAAPSAAKRLFAANPWMRDYPACAIGPTTYVALVELRAARPQIIGPKIDEQLAALCALHEQFKRR